MSNVIELGNVGSIELIDYAGDDTKIINAARVSYNSEINEMTDKDVKLMNFLADHNHGSPFEHNYLSFRVKCPLYIRSQWHRHRVGWSYNEISRRYTEDDVTFYVPEEFRGQHKNNRQSSEQNDGLDQKQIQQVFEDAIAEIYDTYEYLLDIGVCREQARGLLPMTTHTKFIASCNLRSLFHFHKLRAKPDAQAEIQLYSRAMWDLAKEHFPHACASLEKQLTIAQKN